MSNNNGNNSKRRGKKSRKRSKLSPWKLTPEKHGRFKRFQPQYSPSSQSSNRRAGRKIRIIKNAGGKMAKLVQKGNKMEEFLYNDTCTR